MEVAMIVSLLAAGVRSGTAILFATIGEIFAERSGVLNLGVEGMMLMGAMTGYGVSYATGNPWLGLLAAMLVGTLMALLHAFVTVTLRADQVVSGLALTFLGVGMSAVLGAPLVEVRNAPKLPAFDIPVLSQIPILGPILFQHNVIVYMGFILIPVAWFYIYRTRRGMELRAIGEYPAAADVLGVNVYLQRYLYVMLGGCLAGAGGAALSLAITPLWIEGMTAGQGWIAVGLVIFSGWDPLRAAMGSYLFRGHSPPAARLAECGLLSGQSDAGLFHEYVALYLHHRRSRHRLARGHAPAGGRAGRSRRSLCTRRAWRLICCRNLISHTPG